MGSQAKIHDSKALLDTKAALASFVEAVTAALATMDSDMSRVGLWLQQDRPLHWKHEIRRREEKVLAAKAAIHRKIISQAPEPVSLVLERKAVAKAQERLDSARARWEASKRWATVWEREAQLFKGGVGDLSAAIHARVPHAMQRLERMLLSLEQYERLEAPKAPEAEGEAGTDETSRPSSGKGHD